MENKMKSKLQSKNKALEQIRYDLPSQAEKLMETPLKQPISDSEKEKQ